MRGRRALEGVCAEGQQRGAGMYARVAAFENREMSRVAVHEVLVAATT